MRPIQEPPLARFQSPDVRRRQILDATARLAIEQGLDNTSIADVANAAGLAKGSIYLYYESRQQLLSAVQGDVWQRMLDRPKRLLKNGELAWSDKLNAVVEHWMRFEFDNHGLYHAVFHAIAPPTDGDPLAGARAVLGELIKGGIAAGEFDLDTIELDVLLDFLIHGYIGPCFHHNDQEAAVRDVQHLFRRSVGVAITGR